MKPITDLEVKPLIRAKVAANAAPELAEALERIYGDLRAPDATREIARAALAKAGLCELCDIYPRELDSPPQYRRWAPLGTNATESIGFAGDHSDI